MANQAPNVFEAIGQNLYNGLYTGLTGKPVPGSIGAIQAETQKQVALKQLEDLKRNPNDPNAGAKALAAYKAYQDLGLEGQAAQQAINLRTLGANSLLDASGQQADIAIRKGNAATQNEISLLDAKSQKQMDTLARIFEQERYLAGGSDADRMAQVLKFSSDAHEKNLAAQAEARKPNVAALLGSLALGAASLFG